MCRSWSTVGPWWPAACSRPDPQHRHQEDRSLAGTWGGSVIEMESPLFRWRRWNWKRKPMIGVEGWSAAAVTDRQIITVG